MEEGVRVVTDTRKHLDVSLNSLDFGSDEGGPVLGSLEVSKEETPVIAIHVDKNIEGNEYRCYLLYHQHQAGHVMIREQAQARLAGRPWHGRAETRDKKAGRRVPTHLQLQHAPTLSVCL